LLTGEKNHLGKADQAKKNSQGGVLLNKPLPLQRRQKRKGGAVRTPEGKVAANA